MWTKNQPRSVECCNRRPTWKCFRLFSAAAMGQFAPLFNAHVTIRDRWPSAGIQNRLTPMRGD